MNSFQPDTSPLAARLAERAGSLALPPGSLVTVRRRAAQRRRRSRAAIGGGTVVAVGGLASSPRLPRSQLKIRRAMPSVIGSRRPTLSRPPGPRLNGSAPAAVA